MTDSTAQPKRVWGLPASFHPDPASLDESPAPEKGLFIFVRWPSETWSTERLENHVAMLHAAVADGVDPAVAAPNINSANEILRERRAPKDHGETPSVENDSAPKP